MIVGQKWTEISNLIGRSLKEERCKQDNLWVVSDSSLHGASGIVMLDPEPNERCQTAIIFGYGTLNLSRSKALKEAESIRENRASHLNNHTTDGHEKVLEFS